MNIKYITLTIFCLILTGCPATLNIQVTNDSNADILILYSTGYESLIASGETKEEIYKYDCLRIKSNGKTYEFQANIIIDEYIETGKFSSNVYATFTKNYEFEIHQKNKSNIVKLERGCIKEN